MIFWILAGWVGFAVLPWYGVEDGFFSFDWVFDGYPMDRDYAPAAFLLAQGKNLWLAPMEKYFKFPPSTIDACSAADMPWAKVSLTNRQEASSHNQWCNLNLDNMFTSIRIPSSTFLQIRVLK